MSKYLCGREVDSLRSPARYERVREDGIIASQAVMIAIGVDREGRRQLLAVELANRESRSSWKDWLLQRRPRSYDYDPMNPRSSLRKRSR